ncbi:MAG: hypothetical protein Q9180_005786, partial [Flavoplaca navasiana]
VAAGSAQQDTVPNAAGSAQQSTTPKVAAGSAQQATAPKAAAVGQGDSSTPSEAMIECTLEPEDVSAGKATDTNVVKRAPSDLMMEQIPDYGNTYSGFVEDSGPVSCRDVVRYAREGYNQIRNAPGIHQTVIVSALHVEGFGVAVASKPRAAPAEAANVAAMLRSQAQRVFPAYWDLVQYRYSGTTDPLATWHAEDVVLIYVASLYSQSDIQVPDTFSWQAKTSAWGKYHGQDPQGPKRPCRGPNAPLQPPCEEVLTDLEVTIVVG